MREIILTDHDISLFFQPEEIGGEDFKPGQIVNFMSYKDEEVRFLCLSVEKNESYVTIYGEFDIYISAYGTYKTTK